MLRLNFSRLKISKTCLICNSKSILDKDSICKNCYL